MPMLHSAPQSIGNHSIELCLFALIAFGPELTLFTGVCLHRSHFIVIIIIGIISFLLLSNED